MNQFGARQNDDINRTVRTFAHYTDPLFRTEQDVWGAGNDKLFYVYSDRLELGDYDKHEAAREKSDQSARRDTAKYFQDYLSAYYNKPITLKHIVLGVNCSNGFSYMVFGFNEGGAI